MMKPAFALLSASALVMPAAGALAAPQITIAPAGPVVELTAYQRVATAPEFATISAGVVTEAPTASEAMRQNAAQMTKVIARIKALGIAEKDIQTSSVSLGAQYDYLDSGSKFRAYQASNRVSVMLRKIDDTGRVLDALVEAGATDLYGPDFGSDNQAEAWRQARAKAVAVLEGEATAYAKLLGYDGVKVLSVTEGASANYPVLKADAMVAEARATTTPIQPGTITTGVSVTITYELVGKTAAVTK